MTLLLAGPWWGYAYHRWHNPFQSNLAPRASLMMGSQPASFYFSVPLESLVVHPYRPDFSDALLPKLHAELWSDWFGGIHDWDRPTRIEKITASTQSVLQGSSPTRSRSEALRRSPFRRSARVLRRRDELRSRRTAWACSGCLRSLRSRHSW